MVVIDADLQDPPELIGRMLAAWRGGADVVNMRRRVRAGENWFKLATAHAFYRAINRLSDVPIPRTWAISACSAGARWTRSTGCRSAIAS